MANRFYTTFRNNLYLPQSASATDQIDFSTGTIQCVLIDEGTYTYSAAHAYYSSVVAGAIGTPQTLGSKTVGVVAAGVFDAANVTFTAVSGASVESILLFQSNGGANTTWPLIGLIDQVAAGLPVTPNGGDITITFNASGILSIG